MILAVIGSSFCGSTLLGFILGRLSGVEPVGELVNYISDTLYPLWDDTSKTWPNVYYNRVQRSNYNASQLKQTIDMPWLYPACCTSCGESCSIYNTLHGVRHPSLIHDALKTILHAHTIVDTSKLQWYFDELEAFGVKDIRRIYLYKPPWGYVASMAPKEQRPIDSYTDAEILVRATNWARSYSNILAKGSSTSLRYTDLIQDTSSIVSKICQMLKIENIAYQQEKTYHQISGNIHAHYSLKSTVFEKVFGCTTHNTDSTLKLDPKLSAIPNRVIDVCLNDDAINNTLAALQKNAI